MNKYKAVVSDFDGTLVSGSLSLTEPVKEAIKNFVAEGGIFSIATGRDYYGALKDICIDLGLKSFQIVRGGAEIVSAETHEVIWGRYISEAILADLLEYLKKQKGLYFVAERGTKIYTFDAKPEAMFGDKAEFEDLSQLPLDSVPKVFLPPGMNDSEQVLQILKEIGEKFPQLHAIKTAHKQDFGIDINDGGVSKHLALLEYAQLSGLNTEEIIGVGDSYNDYPLLNACGFKVAMGNAPTELKEVADKIVGTQGEDGVVEAISFAKQG